MMGSAEKILLEIIDMLNGDGHETVLYTLDMTEWGRSSGNAMDVLDKIDRWKNELGLNRHSLPR